MMPKLLMAAAFVILAVFLVNTFVLGSSNSMKSEGTRMGNNMIQNVQAVEQTGTIYTP